MPLVPTSGPLDSDHRYAQPTPLAPLRGGDYGPYVQNRALPGPVSIQTAVIWRAPIRTYNNPEWWMAAELPRQDIVSPIGAPPVPYANPGYVTYQAQPVTGNGSYVELIGAYAPRPSAGLLG